MRSSALVLLVAAGLAACGGEPDEPDEPPGKLLDQAFRAGGIDRALSGEAGEPLDLEFTADLARLGIDGRVVLIGEDLYVVFFGENYRADPDTLAALRARLRALGLEPRDLFPSPSYDGVGEVDGEDAVRVVSPGGGLDELEGGTAEAWVSLDDESLRRLRFEVPRRGELDVRVEWGDGVSPPEGGGFRPLEDLLERFGVAP